VTRHTFHMRWAHCPANTRPAHASPNPCLLSRTFTCPVPQDPPRPNQGQQAWCKNPKVIPWSLNHPRHRSRAPHSTRTGEEAKDFVPDTQAEPEEEQDGEPPPPSRHKQQVVTHDNLLLVGSPPPSPPPLDGQAEAGSGEAASPAAASQPSASSADPARGGKQSNHVRLMHIHTHNPHGNIL
jgi:hypothetical protein